MKKVIKITLLSMGITNFILYAVISPFRTEVKDLGIEPPEDMRVGSKSTYKYDCDYMYGYYYGSSFWQNCTYDGFAVYTTYGKITRMYKYILPEGITAGQLVLRYGNPIKVWYGSYTTRMIWKDKYIDVLGPVDGPNATALLVSWNGDNSPDDSWRGWIVEYNPYPVSFRVVNNVCTYVLGEKYTDMCHKGVDR